MSKVVMVSGGFDPVHVGHVRMFKAAKKLGDKVICVVHSDEWLVQKKAYRFMPQEERVELLEAFRDIDEVYLETSLDRSASTALRKIKPDIFANGGDRNEDDAKNPHSTLFKDMETCKELGIEMIFEVGGGKVQSSSALTLR